jgi:hypothetical protein
MLRGELGVGSDFGDPLLASSDLFATSEVNIVAQSVA